MSRMSRHFSSACIAASLVIVHGISAGAQAPTKPPAAGPVKPAAIPAFQEATLSNGLRIMLVESKRHPVVSLALMLPAGDSYDPAGKEGLATVVASVVTKGAGARTADQVSSDIEGVGGSIEASAGPDFMTVRANVLAENAPLAFELVADAVARPSFATKEVELARTQMLSALQLEQSSPSSLAQRFFAAQLFGAHPYGKRPTPTTVRTLTNDDLHAFQQMLLVPNGALLVVAGDIRLARARELAQKHFGKWTGAATGASKRPSPPSRSRTEILLVHRPGSVQSNIIVGNLTYAPSNPSYYATTVGSRILGGGSDGRLFKTLREQKSWTYGAYSQLTRNQGHRHLRGDGRGAQCRHGLRTHRDAEDRAQPRHDSIAGAGARRREGRPRGKPAAATRDRAGHRRAGWTIHDAWPAEGFHSHAASAARRGDGAAGAGGGEGVHAPRSIAHRRRWRRRADLRQAREDRAHAHRERAGRRDDARRSRAAHDVAAGGPHETRRARRQLHRARAGQSARLPDDVAEEERQRLHVSHVGAHRTDHAAVDRDELRRRSRAAEREGRRQGAGSGREGGPHVRERPREGIIRHAERRRA